MALRDLQYDWNIPDKLKGQLALDKLIYGIACVEKDDVGNYTRINPTTLNIESNKTGFVLQLLYKIATFFRNHFCFLGRVLKKV